MAGYELWQLAKLEGWPAVPCLQVAVTEQASLLKLIRSHQRSAGLNDFLRVLLALELEEGYKEQARANQSRGGKLKLPSNLTQAYPVDVRKEIAAAAGVSTGNVTKAKKLIASAHPEILAALKRGEISIYRASQWTDLSLWDQQRAYRTHVTERGMKARIRMLIAKQRPSKGGAKPPALDTGRAFLSSLRGDTHLEQLWPQIDAVLHSIRQLNGAEVEVRP